MQHLTLFELNRLIRQTLDENLHPSYWVVAEISELRTVQKGHCYLELVEKQDDKVIAKLRGTIWAYTFRSISGWFRTITGEDLRAGITVLCQITVQFHELYGLSLNIKDIDARYTLGERARRRQEIIDRLTREGVIEINRSLKLPLVPQRIAVISSPNAAGFGDFMDQLGKNRYNYFFHTQLFTSLMQGENAVNELISALHKIHSSTDEYDAVVIIRGGGSQIDLDCFDNYEIATHVAQFPIPVITGIGHDRDETILDLVAHTRMKTPTAVAEFLISGLCSFEERLNGLMHSISQQSLQRMRLEEQRLQTKVYKLKNASQRNTAASRQDIERRREQLTHTASRLFDRQKDRLQAFQTTIRLLDPVTVLRRGYTLTLFGGKAINGFSPEVGDEIETRTVSRKFFSNITKVADHEQ